MGSARPTPDSVTLLRVPRSAAAFTARQVANRYEAVDWHPERHSPMPRIVSKGERGRVIACAYCHMPDGAGRPENATLAGLSAEYIVQQVADIRSRARRVASPTTFHPDSMMRDVADSATLAEVREAAEYYSRQKVRRRYNVIERRSIPRPVLSLGIHVAASDGSVEPLGRRLIEMPTSTHRHELRDAATTYVAYVPPGSLARGRALATGGRGAELKSCTSCHGPQLRGVGPVPPIAGRSPSYILRQLLAFRAGTRAGATSTPMREVASTLGLDDMIALAAYAGSRAP